MTGHPMVCRPWFISWVMAESAVWVEVLVSTATHGVGQASAMVLAVWVMVPDS